ncbi:unnamed protein product, partial [Polarella glacialis]
APSPPRRPPPPPPAPPQKPHAAGSGATPTTTRNAWPTWPAAAAQALAAAQDDSFGGGPLGLGRSLQGSAENLLAETAPRAAAWSPPAEVAWSQPQQQQPAAPWAAEEAQAAAGWTAEVASWTAEVAEPPVQPQPVLSAEVFRAESQPFEATESSFASLVGLPRKPSLAQGVSVKACFFGEWHAATVWSDQGEFVEVLWNSEYSISKLPAADVVPDLADSVAASVAEAVLANE